MIARALIAPITRLGEQRFAALAAVVLGVLVSSTNVTLIAAALPSIVAQFDATENYALLVLALTVPATLVLPVVGRLSDVYGRRGFYMGGVGVFILGSLLASVAPSFGWLLGARVVQGIGVGSMQVLAQTIIGDIIPPRDRGKYQGITSATFGVSVIAGPLIGGLITDSLGWRWLFLVNVPVALLTLGVAAVSIPGATNGPRRSTDVRGIALFTAAIGIVLLAIQGSGRLYPAISITALAMALIAIAIVLVLVIVELRVDEPMLSFRLWRNRAFTYANVGMIGSAVALYGAVYFVPLFAQGVLGRTAAQAGGVLVPLLGATIVVSILGGQVISRTGRYKALALLGASLAGAGFLLLSGMDEWTSQEDLVRNLVVLGCGIGLCNPIFVILVQNAAPPRDLGIATAFVQLSRSVGSIVGVAVMGAVLSARMDTALTAAALRPVFAAVLPFIALSFVASALIPERPLRGNLRGGVPDGDALSEKKLYISVG